MCALNLCCIQLKLKCQQHIPHFLAHSRSFSFARLFCAPALCVCMCISFIYLPTLTVHIEWVRESFVNWRSLNEAIKCSRDSYDVKMQLTMNAVKYQSTERCTQPMTFATYPCVCAVRALRRATTMRTFKMKINDKNVSTEYLQHVNKLIWWIESERRGGAVWYGVAWSSVFTIRSFYGLAILNE